MDIPEKYIQNYTISLLNGHGWFVWRNNSGTATATDKNGKKRQWKAGIKGSGDIIGVTPTGQFVTIECKRAGKRPTIFQEAFMDDVKRRGGLATVIDSIEAADALVKLF